jgi:uncharacterized protein YkwD
MQFWRRGNRSRRQIGYRLAAVVVAVLSALGSGTVASASSPPTPTTVRSSAADMAATSQVNAHTAAEALAMVTLTNRLRATVGAENLTVRADLTRLACDWAETLAEDNSLEHSPYIFDRELFTSRMGRNWGLAGENVGTGSDVYTIHGALVGSPLHYRNLVNPEFVYVGICVRHAVDGTAFVTEEFLAPKAKHRS